MLRETFKRVTCDEASDEVPLWTPDGKRIIFTSNRTGIFKIYWKMADGTGADEPLSSDSELSLLTESISDDGTTLTLMSSGPALDIGILNIKDTPEWKPLLQGKYAEAQPQISPDGHWLAYMSNESSRFKIMFVLFQM